MIGKAMAGKYWVLQIEEAYPRSKKR